MATKMLCDDEKAATSKPKKERKPRIESRIHVPGHKNAFTYKIRTGARKVDGSLQRFCVNHKCPGVFEVKVFVGDFGLKTKQINAIKYDANEKGIQLSHKSKVNGFDVFVPFPCNLTMRIPKNPEALYLERCGLLLCRIPIVDHSLEIYQFDAHKQPKLGVAGAKRKRKYNQKLDGRLHRNHEKLSLIHTAEIRKDELERENLPAFQKTLWGVETKDERKKREWRKY